MRKLSKILVFVLALAMLTVAFATTVSAAAGETWTVAGSSGLCGSNWSTTDTKNDMTYDSATDSYVKVYYNVKAGNYEFKCAKNHAWGTAYPGSNYNLKVEKDGSTVTITLKGTNVTAKVEAPACDHAYEVTAATVTCLTSGSRTWTCSKCQDTYTENLEALGHHYDATGKCERCDETTTLVRVYVENAAKWADVYCYTWDTNPYVSWPGEKMNYDEESGLYYYDIPKIFVNVIFNNGSGTQSADLKTPTGTATIYNNSTKTWKAPHVCSFSEATCTTLATCSCGKTQGELAAHNYVAGEVVAPTYSAGGYTVYSCVCGLTENRDATDKLVPAFPEATVTPVTNPELTFALNFGIKGVSFVDGEIVLDPEVLTEEYIAAVLETYGRMYVDYRLTISGLSDPSVTFNANGDADGYLGGQYDAWSENWVYVPFDNVVVENGKSLMIMEYAASMMGESGLRQILEEIITVVIDFDCGVYFTPEFLEHNPDMVVTLELLVFNEDENGELTDVITVAENVFTVPHEHSFVEGECDCGELDPAYVNTLVVGDTNKIIVNGDTFNDYGLPVEWMFFVADEKAHYEFVGNNGALCFIFDLDGNLLCLGTGKADLEAGTYAICVGNGFTGVLNVAVTKTEIAVPEHENKLVIGENNKIVVDGSILNQNNNPIAWVPFVVEEKALYTFASETENALVYIFNVDFSMPGGALTSAAVLEPGTYLICVGNGAVGDIYVTVTKTDIPTVCEHVYVYMNCSLCGEDNPFYEHNFMVVGTNKVICNEYHLVDYKGHGNPYQFTTFTVTEDGHYKFTSDKLIGFTIFTTEVNAEGADWTAGTGASWGQ